MIAPDKTIENLKILEVKGDVWLHRENVSKLIADNHHNLNYGDLLVIYPGSEINIELTPDKFLHLIGKSKEALFIDHSVLDQNYNFDEVGIDTSTLTNFLVNFFPESMITDDTSFASLVDQHNFIFSNHHEDSVFNFDDSLKQNESYYSSYIKLADIISDFDSKNDFFTLPRSSSIIKGSNEVIYAQTKASYDIASHKIDNYGFISFKDSQGTDISFKNPSFLDGVVDYLQKNLNAKVGDVLMFKIANDSYLFHYHPDIYSEKFGLTKFEGLSFDGLSNGHDALNGNYLHIDFV